MNQSNPHQEVAVWDTFVHKADGSVLHFDILVPAQIKDQHQIFEYGKRYAEKKGEPAVKIDTSHCQFCHIETTTNDIDKAISKQGYFILEMEDIPNELPVDASKRELILYLKAHFEKFRFTNFSGVPIEVIQRLILIEEERKNNMDCNSKPNITPHEKDNR